MERAGVREKLVSGIESATEITGRADSKEVVTIVSDVTAVRSDQYERENPPQPADVLQPAGV